MGDARGNQVWVTVEDMYDHDTFELGPFTVEQAHRYCDAYNGAQLGDSGDLSADQYPPFGIWNQAYASGYLFARRMAHLIEHPDQIPASAEAIAAAAGAMSRHDWSERAAAEVELDGCWCDDLRAGRVPHAEPPLVEAYYRRCLSPRGTGVVMSTRQHFGDVLEYVCSQCQGTLLKLTVEHESLGDAIHHYVVPVDRDVLVAISKGLLNDNNLEAWFGGRPGIHVDRGTARLYVSATVGYPGIDAELVPAG